MFHIANGLNILAAVSSMIYYYNIGNLTEKNVFLVYLFSDIMYVSMAAIFAIFCIYLGSIIGLSGKRKKIIETTVFVGFVIFALIKVTTPITKIGFYIDENLSVHREYYFGLFTIYYVVYGIITIVMLFGFRNRIVKKVRRSIVAVVALAFYVMIFEALDANTIYTTFTFTLPMNAVLFLFHYNAYDTELGTLDIRSFSEYVREIGEHDFKIIFIYVQEIKSERLKKIAMQYMKVVEKELSDTCTFRMNDDCFALVCKINKKNTSDKIKRVYEEIENICNENLIEYKLVLVNRDERIAKPIHYKTLFERLENRLTMNHLYEVQKKDVDEFIESLYILENLKDIHKKMDLDDARVKVFCQPILNTKTNSFTTAEALMRLELPECGLVFPDKFISLAEKYDYIHTLSKIILNKTCKYLKEAEKEGKCIDRVSINFSVMELRDKNFCEDVISIIARNGVDYKKIAIEFTESKNERDFEKVREIMDNLHKLGIKFYLDDFGTGYSNMERIIDLPIDIIKFDRSLTILAKKDDESKYMVGSFSNIFKNSNYQILFEGIEDYDDEKHCKEMNAMYLQGYKYSRPIPIEKLSEFLIQEDEK